MKNKGYNRKSDVTPPAPSKDLAKQMDALMTDSMYYSVTSETQR